MKKIWLSTVLSTVLLLTNTISAESVLIKKEKYGWKFEAKVIPEKIHYVYSDNVETVTFVNKKLKHTFLDKETLILKYNSQLEEAKYEELFKKNEKELRNLTFLKNQIALKRDLLSKIESKLDKKLKNFTKEDMDNIRSDMYFYEREIYRYNIDLHYEVEKYENLVAAMNDIKSKLAKKKVNLSHVYLDTIYAKEKTTVFKYDKLIKYYSLNNMYFKIELNKQTYKDMVNKMLDVKMYNNKTNVEPDSLEVIESKEGKFYLIIKLNSVSEHFIQTPFDILIRPQTNVIVE